MPRETEGIGVPLFFDHAVVVGGGMGAHHDGLQRTRSLNELDELDPISIHPLEPIGALDSTLKFQRLPTIVEVQNGGPRGRGGGAWWESSTRVRGRWRVGTMLVLVEVCHHPLEWVPHPLKWMRVAEWWRHPLK